MIQLSRDPHIRVLTLKVLLMKQHVITIFELKSGVESLDSPINRCETVKLHYTLKISSLTGRLQCVRVIRY